MNLRAKLGLDPASAARVGRDLALARHMSAGATPLDEALAEIEQRRALTAGSGGGVITARRRRLTSCR